MQLAEFLNLQRITLDEIIEKAKTSLQLTPDDVLFVCGSLVEGLGNEKSDLDLFLVTSRQDIQCTSPNAVMLIVRRCRIDVRVVQRSAVEELIKRFHDWTAELRQPRNAILFSYDDRKLLNRIRVGEPLWGAENYRKLQDQINLTDLAKHRLDCARYHAGTIQVDLAGLRSAGDQYSMLFASQELLGHTVDALLAGHHYPNFMAKWRVRQLMDLPSQWELELPGRPFEISAMDVYLSLHSAPQTLSPSAIFNHAQRIVAFSRRVLPWAEYRLLGPNSIPLNAASTGHTMTGQPLPHLDLDVAIRYRNGSFELFRLQGKGEIFSLSEKEYSLLCLFDGETSRDYAIREAERLVDKDTGSDLIEALMALVQHGELEGKSFLNESALREILRPGLEARKKTSTG